MPILTAHKQGKKITLGRATRHTQATAQPSGTLLCTEVLAKYQKNPPVLKYQDSAADISFSNVSPQGSQLFIYLKKGIHNTSNFSIRGEFNLVIFF